MDERVIPYEIIEKFDLPEDVNISINNTLNAESSLLFQDGKLADVSLVLC